jgi:CheY-like chemotaxis protein
MMSTGTILIADDESSFLRSTAELLRNEGYECDAARDADEGIQMLQQRQYDVLIADIKMPGNHNLRIIRETQTYVYGIPVILVTGYPSIESAVDAVGLPVVAYLTKPVDYETLLTHVRAAMRSRPLRRVLKQICEDLQKCVKELEVFHAEIPQHVRNQPDADSGVPALTIRRLASCLGELLKIRDGQIPRGTAPHLCQLIDCPEWPAHQVAFRDVIQVLQEIKRRFKSKELAELRERIERHLENQRQ